MVNGATLASRGLGLGAHSSVWGKKEGNSPISLAMCQVTSETRERRSKIAEVQIDPFYRVRSQSFLLRFICKMVARRKRGIYLAAFIGHIQNSTR